MFWVRQTAQFWVPGNGWAIGFPLACTYYEVLELDLRMLGPCRLVRMLSPSCRSSLWQCTFPADSWEPAGRYCTTHCLGTVVVPCLLWLSGGIL